MIFGSKRREKADDGTVEKSSSTLVVAPPTLMKSPVTVNARTFLLARHVALLSSTAKSATEKGVDAKIASLRLRGAHHVVLPPKPPKDSSSSSSSSSRKGRPTTPVSGALSPPRSSPPKKDTTSEKAASPDQAEDEGALSRRRKEAHREGVARAVKVLLTYFVATRYMRRLKQYSEHEAIAGCFRISERMSAFLIRWQMRAKKRVRRKKLLRLWAARVLVIVAVVRHVRKVQNRNRRRHASLIQQFLGDCLAQCGRMVRFRIFRRRVVVCQRWSRAFLACNRARVQALGIKLARLHAHHAPGSRHAASRYLARCRAIFLQERKEHHRLLLSNDSTPAFKQLDVYAVRAFLLEEQEHEQPPQYRGRSTLSNNSGPMFLCFSRPHINEELRELSRDTNSLHAPHMAAPRKAVVKIQAPKPSSPLSPQRKRERKKKTENPFEDPFFTQSREVQALIKVLQSRVRERTSAF